MSDYDSDRAKEKLLKIIRRDKRTVRRELGKKVFTYTFIGLIILGLGHSFYTVSNPAQGTEGKSDGKDVVQLQLSDGTVKTLSEIGSTSIFNKKGRRVGLQKGSQLIYNKSLTVGETVYNTLSVPYGKRFKVVLADGTKVHLNSGSSIRFPVRFERDNDREVHLKGEGYFEVANDRGHPFIVHTERLNIKVLGTEFNVSAYPEDETINTVLVEGSVRLFEEDNKYRLSDHRLLEPGQIAMWQKGFKKLVVEETNTEIYTGWRDGILIFDHMPFKEIRKKLERSFNISISNAYNELDDIRFTASFDTETIEEVLQAFQKNHPMQFSVTGNKIKIEKPPNLRPMK